MRSEGSFLVAEFFRRYRTKTIRDAATLRQSYATLLGQVYGIEGLTVADASIMPVVPSAPTNLTTMMIAEHLARRAANQAAQAPTPRE